MNAAFRARPRHLAVGPPVALAEEIRTSADGDQQRLPITVVPIGGGGGHRGPALYLVQGQRVRPVLACNSDGVFEEVVSEVAPTRGREGGGGSRASTARRRSCARR